MKSSVQQKVVRFLAGLVAITHHFDIFQNGMWDIFTEKD